MQEEILHIYAPVGAGRWQVSFLWNVLLAYVIVLIAYCHYIL